MSRRLTAIVAADIASYSALMGADEVATVRDLKGHQSVIFPMIAGYSGRIIDTAGDGVMAEFASVLNAVKCAAAIQETMAERNAAVEPDRRMQFRIGINQGDVVFDEQRIYGDGINIAARLEGVTEPGGICISGKVYEEIKGKVELQFIDMGEQQFKNIPELVRTYKVRLSGNTGGVTRSAAQPAQPSHRTRWLLVSAALLVLVGAGGAWWGLRSRLASDWGSHKATPRLSIVVLPFSNLSGDPEQDYFADGITEDLTTDLSRIAGSFVIARNTAFTFKNKATDVRHIGRELGVRYALEGSVRRIGNEVRVSAQLIDTATGAHLWADRFDGDRSKLGQLQDDVTARLARSLDLQLTEAENRRAQQERPNNPDAVDLAMRGWAALNRPRSRESVTEARDLFERAMQMDPLLQSALIGLSRALANLASARWTDDVEQALARATDLASRALLAEPQNALAHLAKCEALRTRRFDEAIAECEAAIAHNPNLPPSYGSLALTKIFAGRSEEAFAPLEMALRLSPRDPFLHYWYLLMGHAHEHLGHHEEAIQWATKSVTATTAPMWIAYIDLIAAYGWTGQTEKAPGAITALHKLMPGYTAQKWVTTEFSSNPTFIAQQQRMGEGLRKAGLPEQ